VQLLLLLLMYLRIQSHPQLLPQQMAEQGARSSPKPPLQHSTTPVAAAVGAGAAAVAAVVLQACL
jgi:hypothetical protein